jgi:amino acid transporter
VNLPRGIGAFGIALIVLNSMIGAGIFALPAAGAAAVGGFGPWLFLIVGLLFMSIVLSFSELSSYFSATGGPVLYTQTAFGPLVGFSTGWILYVSRVTAFAANVTVMAAYASAFVPWFAEGLGRGVFITAVIGLLTGANYLGVRDGVRTLAVFSVLKLTPLLLIILAGLREISPEVLPQVLPSLTDLGGVSLLVIYAFVGFEAATVVSGEVVRAKRTMPRALLFTVAAVAVFYFMLVLVYVATIPEAQRASASLREVGGLLLGDWAATLVALAAIFSIGGNLAATLLAASRITFALGEQKLLPQWTASEHPRFASPGNSILLLGALGLALALSGTFVVLAVASSLTRLITYVLCFASLPAIRRAADAKTRAEAFRPPGGNAMPVLATLLCLWMILQSTLSSWLVTGGMLLLGLLLYWSTHRD